MNMPQQDGIDFVIAWVDGGDPEWQRDMARYLPEARGETDVRPERYRNWDLLRYWFRGVERFAPWVRRIHFLTWGHLPPWLDTSHPKLHVTKHGEFLPQSAVPTFNCNAFEANLHRIPGLSERFVYFNDDMMLLREVRPEDFFRGDKPRDMLVLQPVVANPANPVMSHLLLNESLTLCKYFDKRRSMRAHPGQYFHPGYPLLCFFYNLLETLFPLYTGFYTVHGPSPMLRSTFAELWEKEGELLNEVTCRRFRDSRDVNQYLFRSWEKLKGNFVPANLHRDFSYFNIQDTEKACRFIRQRRKKMVCVNDTSEEIDFPAVKRELTAAFQAILPQPSAFEADR